MKSTALPALGGATRSCGVHPLVILHVMPDPSPSAPKKPVKIAPPTGTRDFYPREMLVRRYITDAWRRTALRHGFDEIDGPTFESAELYKVKSGEGILNEMFGTYSGKSPDDVEAVKRGEPPFGLRPEFTPTLARMYAARAKQLPQPTKWFCVSNFFRAERPQRGRLREFWQWNCDVIGGDNKSAADIEAIACVLALMESCGLVHTEVQVALNHREAVYILLGAMGIEENKYEQAALVLDQFTKLDPIEFHRRLREVGASPEGIKTYLPSFGEKISALNPWTQIFDRYGHDANETLVDPNYPYGGLRALVELKDTLVANGIAKWCYFDESLARGLAYYTGTVFEVIAEGERAVAGGGRYDNLIELFGGPPTPACGFGMGDAVLGNLLEDRNLIPEGKEMLEALARPMPYRPDVFVIASPNPGCEELIVPTVARLRRGEESEKYKQGEAKPWSVERYAVPPLHARRSYKATKNVGKLLADAAACQARFAAIIESPESCTLKDMDANSQETVPLESLGRACQRG